METPQNSKFQNFTNFDSDFVPKVKVVAQNQWHHAIPHARYAIQPKGHPLAQNTTSKAPWRNIFVLLLWEAEKLGRNGNRKIDRNLVKNDRKHIIFDIFEIPGLWWIRICYRQKNWPAAKKVDFFLGLLI